ncbi:hypothetical protein HMPREF2086_00051 [Helicobacter macacae MIT 99-5501]|uniref:Uncharacterized protein n=1 Tax=Helicobacter macacae MIT 99-5501 TaxID=1357400 RepID=V8CBD1_9HELI|nr:hypothetical protein HMPREF2086_00051 [Helicobacter macacae MIT 99-5501]
MDSLEVFLLVFLLLVLVGGIGGYLYFMRERD